MRNEFFNLFSFSLLDILRLSERLGRLVLNCTVGRVLGKFVFCLFKNYAYMEITTVLSVWESFIFEDETEYEYEIQVKVFVRVLKKKTPRGASSYFFSPKKLVRSFILKEVKPSSDGTMIKLLTFDNLLTPLRRWR